MRSKKVKSLCGVFWCFAILVAFSSANAAGLTYCDPNNWAYCGGGKVLAHEADVFFIGPTVFMGSDTQFNMPLDDAGVRQNFLGAVNMEKGIYDLQAAFYAPYYRQAGLNVYRIDPVAAQPYFEIAYQDVKAAFLYYLKEYNQNRPIVLAGFSQGADMIVRLMKDLYVDPKLQERLVAAYVIGWRVTAEELAQYPHLKMAQGEFDTGVIVSFNTEAPAVKASLIVPHKTLGINPLNWQTTSEPADKLLNKGGVFTGYDGKIIKEINHLTGAYLDANRGTLKVTDISAAEYPPVLDIFVEGVYHVYDYLFFYRNLQANVIDRINGKLMH